MAAGWQRWGWVARWAGTAAGIAYVATLIDPHDVGAAFQRITVGAWVLAIALVGLNVVAGAERWRFVLRAYGSDFVPTRLVAIRHYYVAFFYNNFLPGAVAGDVVRGIVTKNLAVVFVERALGLFGVFLLLAIGLATSGGALATDTLWSWSVAGIVGSFALVLALPLARRFAPHLPGKLGELVGRVPELRSAAAFAGATLLSVATQLFVALAGWVLLRTLAPNVGLGESLLIVPLAAATTFLPITVGGAGAREAVYVTLGASLFHMARADALAASLALWVAHLINGAVGGAIQLARRR